MLLLIASYVFYSFWDWRFLCLLVFSTLLDYSTGLQIHSSTKKNNRRFWFWLSVLINLGFLGVFKYYNFFIESLSDGLSIFGLRTHLASLQVILPVGISFYTFHGLSYIIDIYKGRIVPEKNFISYSVFVSFFPLLVAGPIERATHLLPQIIKKREFSYTLAVDGLRQILWGLFKKIVIADNCAEFANEIFNNSPNYTGSTYLVGAIFFTFQIYGDFSGYSDIALGLAKLLGIRLLNNFSFPYFSRDIAEFWRRWHISLSSWFKDYVYIPLGGSQVTTSKRIRNVFIIFLLSGFWHGANWTFIIWGFLNALFILPLIIFNINRNNLDVIAKGRTFPNTKEVFSLFITMTMVMFAWIFFRANDVNQAVSMTSSIFSDSLLTLPKFPGIKRAAFISCIIIIFVIIEWVGREQQYALANFGLNWKRPFRYLMYYLIVVSIFWYAGKEKDFIYFQF